MRHEPPSHQELKWDAVAPSAGRIHCRLHPRYVYRIPPHLAVVLLVLQQIMADVATQVDDARAIEKPAEDVDETVRVRPCGDTEGGHRRAHRTSCRPPVARRPAQEGTALERGQAQGGIHRL